LKKEAALYAVKKMAKDLTFVTIVVAIPVIASLMLAVFALSVVNDVSKLMLPIGIVSVALATWFVYGLFICYYDDYFIRYSAEHKGRGGTP